MLADLLTRDTVAIDVPATDWRDAIYRAGQLLVDRGDVEREYVAAMIREVEDQGPYIVVAPGIALAHAQGDRGVNRTCASFVRLARSVEFGHERNDPVDFVFAVGAVDRAVHLNLLQSLANLLSDPFSLEAIREAATVEELLEVFRQED